MERRLGISRAQVGWRGRRFPLASRSFATDTHGSHVYRHEAVQRVPRRVLVTDFGLSALAIGLQGPVTVDGQARSGRPITLEDCCRRERREISGHVARRRIQLGGVLGRSHGGDSPWALAAAKGLSVGILQDGGWTRWQTSHSHYQKMRWWCQWLRPCRASFKRRSRSGEAATLSGVPRTILLTVLFAVAAAGSAQAQQPFPGAISGMVLDSVGKTPVPGALVLMDDGRSVYTPFTGRFFFANVPSGLYRVAAIAPGCGVAQGEVFVQPGSESAVLFNVVTVGGAEPIPPHLRSSTVKVITASDLALTRTGTIAEAIRSVAPDMVAPGGYIEGTPLVGPRGRTTVTGSIEPVVYVDGIRMGNPAQHLSYLQSDQVLRIEISRGSAAGWSIGTGGANGVIRIFTRRGQAGEAASFDPERCHFTFALREGRRPNP